MGMFSMHMVRGADRNRLNLRMAQKFVYGLTNVRHTQPLCLLLHTRRVCIPQRHYFAARVELIAADMTFGGNATAAHHTNPNARHAATPYLFCFLTLNPAQGDTLNKG